MRTYYQIDLEAGAEFDLDLKADMGLQCGAEEIAVTCTSGEVMCEGTHFAIPVPQCKYGYAHLKFPVIDGKSPCIFTFCNTSGEDSIVLVLVEKFGGEPDKHYFKR